MLIATESELNSFRMLLRQYTGFNFPKGLDREFNNKLERALDNTPLSLSQLLRQLQVAPTFYAAISLLTPLLNELLIGETYFWRDPEIFEALNNYVLPELVKRKGNLSELLRVWSAACSTGEEVYSLSILLQRYFKGTDWLLSLLGTDLNEKSLEIARKAEYGNYSLRGAAQHQGLLGSFEPLPGRLRPFKVKKEYLSGVRFQKLNLASQDYPWPGNDTCNYDIIFCRNIFIYFTPELTSQIINRLYEALNEGGYLVVSPCEYSQQFLTRFEAVQVRLVTLYRRPVQVDKWSALPQPKLYHYATRPVVVNQAAPSLPSLPELPLKIKAAPTANFSATRLLMQAKEALLNGQVQEAQELAQEVSTHDSLNAESYLFLTSLYQDSGQLEQALEMARRFVYLAPQRPEGQFFLAKLQQSLGLKKRSAQAYRRLLDLTDSLNSDLCYPYLAGLSVKELRQLAYETLANLETYQTN